VSKTSLLGIFVGIAASLAGQTVGSISGMLVGDDGTPQGAVVTVNGVPPLRSSGSAKANANGSFTIGNLLPGKYHICAEVGSAGYLDPCAWEPVPIVVQIAAGQSLSGYQLVARKGVPLQVRINDPVGLLTSTVPLSAGSTTPSLLIGIFTPRGLFQPLATTGVDAAGFNKQITIPSNAPVRLNISGQGLSIQNASGASLNTTGTLITVTANGTITFTVGAIAVGALP
jgi:hypothetical protein